MTARVIVLILSVVVSSLSLGGTALALDFGLHVGDASEQLAERVGLAWAVGAGAIPLEFRWDEVEAAPGRFAWSTFDNAVRAARDFGMRLVGVLHYPESLPPLSRTSRAGWPSAHVDDWEYFVQRVVTRYGADIGEWIVVRGREPGGDPFLAAAEAGVDAMLVQATAATVKRARPGSRLFAAVPGADLWWLSVFAAQGGLRSADGLALDVNRWPVAPEGLEVVIDDVVAVAAEAGHAPDLWVWRFGYPTHIGISWGEPRRTGVSPREQAAFLVRAHVIAASAGVELVLYDELLDRSYDLFDARANFGLYEYRGDGKPGALAYMAMTRLLGGLNYASLEDLPEIETMEPAEMTVTEALETFGPVERLEVGILESPESIESVETNGTVETVEAVQTVEPSETLESLRTLETLPSFDTLQSFDTVAMGETGDQHPEYDLRGDVTVGSDNDEAVSAPAAGTATLLTELDVARVLADAEDRRVLVHVHHFMGDGRHVLVVWTSDGPGRSNAHSLNALDGWHVQMYDVLGQRLEELSIGPEPVYIELMPECLPR